jgi:hypothetical protein
MGEKIRVTLLLWLVTALHWPFWQLTKWTGWVALKLGIWRFNLECDQRYLFRIHPTEGSR